MPTKSDPISGYWHAQAEFMRVVGATHATWGDNGKLTSLTLLPRPEPGPAARLADFHERHARTTASAAQRQHDVMFAASRVKPKLITPEPPPSVVPRAVRAKEEAARRGASSD